MKIGDLSNLTSQKKPPLRFLVWNVFYLVRDIKPPNNESCFPQFFPRFFLSLSRFSQHFCKFAQIFPNIAKKWHKIPQEDTNNYLEQHLPGKWFHGKFRLCEPAFPAWFLFKLQKVAKKAKISKIDKFFQKLQTYN